MSLSLPFSHDEFLDVFAAYNTALWPFAAILWALSLGAFILAAWGRRGGRAIMALLALHWLWAGIAYHWAYFTAINPAAYGFAAVFLVQAALLGLYAWRSPARFVYVRTPRHVAGAVLAGYGLVYPALASLLVASYPRIPTFGVPCPTTLFTIGLLLMETRLRSALLIIPLLWSVIGGSAAVLLGILPDLALLTAVPVVVLAIAAARLTSGRARPGARQITDRLRNSVTSRPIERVDFRALSQLPPPVLRYFERVLVNRETLIRTASMRQSGQIRTSTTSSRWWAFTAEQTVAPPSRGFVWDARVKMPLGFKLRVVDSYVAGIGAGRVSALSIVPLAADSGAEPLNSGALHRYLAEAVWYPTALLPQAGVCWTPVDDRAAVASLTDHGLTVSLEFRFDAFGDVTGIYSHGRFGRFEGTYKLMPWEGRFRGHHVVGGVRIPAYGEVGWHVEGGFQLVWKGQVDAIEYE